MDGFEQAELTTQWNTLLQELSSNFGDIEDVKDITFLIGVQELGLGYQSFSKDEKLEVMHIGICTILSEFGYYEFSGRDKEGWPHYTIASALPEMTEKENEILMKKAILAYFRKIS